MFRRLLLLLLVHRQDLLLSPVPAMVGQLELRLRLWPALPVLSVLQLEQHPVAAPAFRPSWKQHVPKYKLRWLHSTLRTRLRQQQRLHTPLSPPPQPAVVVARLPSQHSLHPQKLLQASTRFSSPTMFPTNPSSPNTPPNRPRRRTSKEGTMYLRSSIRTCKQVASRLWKVQRDPSKGRCTKGSSFTSLVGM